MRIGTLREVPNEVQTDLRQILTMVWESRTADACRARPVALWVVGCLFAGAIVAVLIVILALPNIQVLLGPSN